MKFGIIARLALISSLIFFTTNPAFALSSQRAGQLRSTWRNYVKAHAPLELKGLTDFISNSKALIGALEDGETVTLTQVIEILAGVQKELLPLLKSLTEDQFEAALIPTRISAEIRSANSHRSKVMEMANYLAFLARKFPEQMMEEMRKNFKANQEHTGMVCEEIREHIRKNFAEVARLEKLLHEVKNPRPSGKTAIERMRNLTAHRAANKPIIVFYERSIALTKERISISQKFLMEQETSLKKRFDPSKVTLNIEFNEDISTGKLDRGMPVLRLLSQGLTNDDLAIISESVAKDLFLTTADFENLDDSLLNEQSAFSKKALETVKKQMSEYPEEKILEDSKVAAEHGFAIDATNANAYIRLLEHIVNLHDLELKRRSTVSNFGNGKEKAVAELDYHSEEDSERIEAQETTTEAAASAPSQKTWTVSLHSSVTKIQETLDENQAEILTYLIQELEANGPQLKSKSKGLDRRLRNFSSLSKTVYHCHLGSDELVAVWETITGAENSISIYYLGHHPKTYKRTLKGKIQNTN